MIYLCSVLRCEAGFDGGLDQVFMLEVIDVVSEIMLANVTNVQPVFIITGLNPGRDLRLVVFAINKNGRSEATVMEGFTTKVAQLQVGESLFLVSSKICSNKDCLSSNSCLSIQIENTAT